MNAADLDLLLRLLLGLLGLLVLHVALAAATAKVCTGSWPYQSERATRLFSKYL